MSWRARAKAREKARYALERETRKCRCGNDARPGKSRCSLCADLAARKYAERKLRIYAAVTNDGARPYGAAGAEQSPSTAEQALSVSGDALTVPAVTPRR